MLKKTLISAALVVLALFGYSYKEVGTTLNVASGYAAKQLCSGYYNSGYQFDQIMYEALIPIDASMKHVSYELDEQTQTLHTSVYGLFARQAKFREGMGCSLLGTHQNELTGAITPHEMSNQYGLALPWPEGDGAPVFKKNINHKMLSRALDTAFAENANNGLKQTKGVVVIHKGELIAERYVAPIDQFTPSLSNSMAKSVTNLLVGTLVKQGKLNINEPVALDAWQEDARKDITLDNLLRMSSGLKFDESYGLNTDVTVMLANVTSTSDFAMNMPLEYPIDSHWSYSSGTSNIISRIVFDTISGDLQNKYDYLYNALLVPLGMTSAFMETDGSNVFVGSTYFYASARDWAKLGQLLLQDGYWKGQQILPDGWVEYSSTPTKTAPKQNYGAHFWLNSLPSDGVSSAPWPSVPHDTFFMSGYQGQYVVVIPSKELVVVRLGITHPGTNSGMNTLLASVISAIENQ